MRRWENWISSFLTFAGTLNFRDNSREFHFCASFPQLSRSRCFSFMPKVTRNSFRLDKTSTVQHVHAIVWCCPTVWKLAFTNFSQPHCALLPNLVGLAPPALGQKSSGRQPRSKLDIAGLSKERNAQDIPRLKQSTHINANPPFRIEQNHYLHFFALLWSFMQAMSQPVSEQNPKSPQPLHHPLPRLCSARRLWPKEVVQWLLTMSQLLPGCHTVSQFHEILSLTSFNIWRWAIQRSPFKISLMFKVVFQNSRAGWPKTCCFHLHFMMMTANWTFLIYQPAFVGVKQRVFASNSPEPFRHSQRKWGRSSTFHWAVVPAGTKRYPTMGWPRQVMDFTMGRLRRTR